MNELEKQTSRREFLKAIACLGAIGTTVTMTAMTISAGTTLTSLLLDNEKIGPISKKDVEQNKGSASSYDKPVLIDKNVSDTSFRLCGVYHTRGFAQANYTTLEKLIENSSAVVVEAAMERINNKILDHNHVEAYRTTGAFFSTVAELGKKYGKPLIDLDSITGRASLTELLLGIGGAVYSTHHAYKIAKYTEHEKINRRSVIKSGLKALAGSYLAISSMFSSDFLKNRIYMGNNKKRYEHEKYYFSHTIDQRNVKITERLLDLPNLLKEDDIKGGNYILAIFGAAHIIGINHYIDHPIQRNIKSLIYKYTYDLIDYNTISKFVSQNDSWKKIILKE